MARLRRGYREVRFYGVFDAISNSISIFWHHQDSQEVELLGLFNQSDFSQLDDEDAPSHDDAAIWIHRARANSRIDFYQISPDSFVIELEDWNVWTKHALQMNGLHKASDLVRRRNKRQREFPSIFRYFSPNW